MKKILLKLSFLLIANLAVAQPIPNGPSSESVERQAFESCSTFIKDAKNIQGCVAELGKIENPVLSFCSAVNPTSVEQCTKNISLKSVLDRNAVIYSDNHPDPVQPVIVISKAVGDAPGTIICPDFETAKILMYVYSKAATEQRASIATRGQSDLVNGRHWVAPKPSQWNCVVVQPGQEMTLTPGSAVPILSVRLPNGKTYRGVSMWATFDYK